MRARWVVMASALVIAGVVNTFGQTECGKDGWTAGTTKEVAEDLTFFVTVPEKCLNGGCGLILDLAGQSMSADAEDLGTHLRDLVTKSAVSDSKHGFVLIQAGGSGSPRSWRFQNPGTVYDYSTCVMEKLKITPRDVHIGGFSQGAHIAALLFCGHPDRFASAALIAGGANVVSACLTAGEDPAPPPRSLLYVHGASDLVVPSKQAERLVEGLKTTFGDGLKIEQVSEQETTYTANRVFVDVIMHPFTGGFTGSHCIPGGEGPVGCEANLNMGARILEFYIRHPKVQ